MKDRVKCERCARRISILGLIGGLFLAGFKLTIGFLGRSRALIASGMCNLSDVSSALIVILGVKYSRKNPNRRFQYGYGKVEFIAQVAMSALMIFGNVILIFSSFVVIAKRIIIIPHTVVFFTALISMVVNGLIYKFAKCGAKELNSPALRSHAEHNKIDVVSSILVAVGVLASRIGLHWADPLIAIFESFHIIHGSWGIFWDGFKGIMDTSAPQGYIDEIRESIRELDSIKGVPMLRARQSGQKILLDMAIEIDPELSVFESKALIQSLRSHLRSKDRYLEDIFVQVRPKNGILQKTGDRATERF
ncbi:MAG: cation diffusion facilitator family transporter [Candidatus Omnitrophica bacterium]|nr:cation diffusion facilitator family transporter [Candidatus Omnitrophota bacterium]